MTVELEGLETGVSRYGSACGNLVSAVAVLRAKASAHGIKLQKATPLDQAAAALGADAWMLILRSSSLELPLAYGEGAVKALAAILARAAGHAGEPCEFSAGHCASETSLIFAAESHARWAEKMVGNLAPSALRRAASDLSAAGPQSRLSHYAELLLIVADKLELPSVFT